jgi:hypothetical protein
VDDRLAACAARHLVSANAPHGFNRGEIAFGLVNENGVSIHHAGRKTVLLPTAFIFDEWRAHMVNGEYSPADPSSIIKFRVNFALKNMR